MSAKQNSDIVDGKLAKELQKGRIAGPFHSEPFENFKRSISINPSSFIPKAYFAIS